MHTLFPTTNQMLLYILLCHTNHSHDLCLTRLNLNQYHILVNRILLICKDLKNHVKFFSEKLDNTIAAQNYQRISGIEINEEERTLICRVIKLNDEIATLMECTDLPFVDDEEVIGKWETVGEYAVKKEFFEAKPCKQNWYYEYPQIIYFLPKGESYWCYHWTKGKLLIETGDTASINTYEIEEYNGKRFMFVSFKSYDYRKGGIPRILVLKQLDHEKYSAKELARKDNIEMPFVNDPQVIGKWKTFDFILSKEDFSPAGSGEPPIFFKEIEFFEGGSCTSLYGKVAITAGAVSLQTTTFLSVNNSNP